jgi:hypothetical protein
MLILFETPAGYSLFKVRFGVFGMKRSNVMVFCNLGLPSSHSFLALPA